MDAAYPMTPYVPPIYQDARRVEEYRPMNRIGFANRDEVHHEYKTDANYPRMDEMGRRTSPVMMGHAKGGEDMKLTREMADEWMAGLENEDGTKGPHWTLEQVKQVMAQKGVKAEPLEFYAILNSMYADYCKVFRKHGVGDKLDFYVDMARAFIEDKGAGEGKVSRYFTYVVRD